MSQTTSDRPRLWMYVVVIAMTAATMIAIPYVVKTLAMAVRGFEKMVESPEENRK